MPFVNTITRQAFDRARKAAKKKSEQDIFKKISKVKNPKRRQKCLKSFKLFCETYFKNRFFNPWSQDHIEILKIMEEAARVGGTFPICMPRSGGKSALSIVLCIFACLAGLRNFVLLIGATKPAVNELIDSIKKELESNALLAVDFPKEVGPFVLLEGEARKAIGQRYKGQRTFISWKQNEIVFAEIPGSKSSGCLIRVTTITGRIRGAIFTTRDGRQIGPSLVIADDPQTDKSAKSKTQTEFRENILMSTVRGLARTGVKIGLLIPCTVIRKNDLADRLMDAQLHPDLRSKRTKMIYTMPENLDLWEQYLQIYADDKINGGDGNAATDFYKANREAMDKGARPAWLYNFDPTEISAVQHAMNWYLFNRAGFFAECQGEPLEERMGSGRIDACDILSKLNGRPLGLGKQPGQIPKACHDLTAFVDVNEGLLYFHVSAWAKPFTGCRIDYGAWPPQPDLYYTMETARNPLASAYPGKNKQGIVYAGLLDLLKYLIAARYQRDDGVWMPIDVIGVDSRFDQKIVAAVIRVLDKGKLLLPTMGVGIPTQRRPFTAYKPEPGKIFGHHWMKAKAAGTEMITLSIDANRWKSIFRDLVKAAPGQDNSFSFNGDPKRPQAEQMYCEQMHAEIPKKTSGPWGDVEIWELPPDKPDNHIYDSAVNCVVLANERGYALPEWGDLVKPRRDPMSRPTAAQLAGRA